MADLPEDLLLLKKTRTLDPRTGQHVNARVISDGRCVYLQAEGSDARTLIERDLELYKLLIPEQVTPLVSHLVIEPTYRCNLECPLCFTHDQGQDLSLEEIAAAIAPYRNHVVSISGGEPTLRDDLAEIIRVVSRENIPLLATNGLRLVERNLVEELKRAGLRHITFSLNGFSEAAQLSTNGRLTLEQKLQALENLVAADMRFLLSMLLLRNGNETEIGRVLELATRHPRQIKEVRLRSAMPMGKHSDLVPFFPSEIITLICEQTGIIREDLLRELRLYRTLGDRIPALKVMQKSCSFSFFLRREGSGLRPLGSQLNWREFFHLGDVYPIGTALQSLLGRKSIWHHDDRLLKISIRVWPMLSSLDMQDHFTGCNTRYVAGPKKGFPVCYANILFDNGWLERQRP